MPYPRRARAARVAKSSRFLTLFTRLGKSPAVQKPTVNAFAAA
jgi:hypothetical protein